MKNHFWLGLKKLNPENKKLERFAWECGRCKVVYPKKEVPPFQECKGKDNEQTS